MSSLLSGRVCMPIRADDVQICFVCFGKPSCLYGRPLLLRPVPSSRLCSTVAAEKHGRCSFYNAAISTCAHASPVSNGTKSPCVHSDCVALLQHLHGPHRISDLRGPCVRSRKLFPAASAIRVPHLIQSRASELLC